MTPRGASGSGGPRWRHDLPTEDAVVGVVMKFGGTSVADPEAIDRLIGIVRHQQRTSPTTARAPVVVVSALAGVTDQLVAVARMAEDGDADRAAAALHALLDRHVAVATAVTSQSRAGSPRPGESRVRTSWRAWCTRWPCCARSRRDRTTPCSRSASSSAAASWRPRSRTTACRARGSTRARSWSPTRSIRPPRPT